MLYVLHHLNSFNINSKRNVQEIKWQLFVIWIYISTYPFKDISETTTMLNAVRKVCY